MNQELEEFIKTNTCYNLSELTGIKIGSTCYLSCPGKYDIILFFDQKSVELNYVCARMVTKLLYHLKIPCFYSDASGIELEDKNIFYKNLEF